MKFYLPLIGLLLTSPLIATENLNFHGALVAKACTIHPDSKNIDHPFNATDVGELYTNHRTAGEVFRLTLQECNTDVSNAVTITFNGITNPALPNLLKLDDSSEASGFAIGIEDSVRIPIRINATSNPYLLSNGIYTLTFYAYLRGEPEAIANRTLSPGHYSASATFRLDYP